jgi:NADH-quinone oxidoreductase subunit N
MLQNPAELPVAITEMWIVGMALLTTVVGLFAGKKYPSATYGLVQITLLGALFLNISQLGLPQMYVFHGMYVLDDLSGWLKIFIDITALGSFYYARTYIQERNMPDNEYYLLGLLSVFGMMVLCSAGSLLTIYLGLETLSFPIYAMMALRRDRENPLEAAIKYFVMGAIASGMLLYGMSMIYGATGTIDLSEMLSRLDNTSKHYLLASFGLVFLIAGIGFKLASTPFHMWAPDVYSGAPTSVTLFLSTAPELAGIAMAIRLLVFGLTGMKAQWQPLLIILSVLSIAVSGVVAIVQTNIKRLLAYSAVGHMGYALFGLIAGTQDGYAFALFYVLIYSITGLAAFGLITLMSHSGIDVENIDDFKGLNSQNPWLAFLMMMVMFSLAGVPPMVGFFAKLFVLKALVDVQLIGLAIYGLIMAVISAFYYIRVVKTMYFDSPAEGSSAQKVVLSKGNVAVITVNAFALLALGFFPGALVQACLTTFSSTY